MHMNTLNTHRHTCIHMHSNQINLARHLALGIEENWQCSPQRVIYKPLFILMPREVETGKRPDFITHTKKSFILNFFLHRIAVMNHYMKDMLKFTGKWIFRTAAILMLAVSATPKKSSPRFFLLYTHQYFINHCQGMFSTFVTGFNFHMHIHTIIIYKRHIFYLTHKDNRQSSRQ